MNNMLEGHTADLEFHELLLDRIRVRTKKPGDLPRVSLIPCQDEKKDPFSCPSCHQKGSVEFGEWVLTHVLPTVPYRHFVFSIPKILSRLFLRDRRLLADLSRCGGLSEIGHFPLLAAAIARKPSVAFRSPASQGTHHLPEARQVRFLHRNLHVPGAR